MILCLDIGNSQIYGGVFESNQLKFQFRKSSKDTTSDEYGLFLRTVLKENSLNPQKILQISICSVVPEMISPIKKACKDYFNIDPFILKPGVKTGLKIKYHNPLEVGTDRIANAISGTHLFPNQNLIIIDFGTAITFCAINSLKEYLGGIILPGLSISMKALENHAAKLPSVEITPPLSFLGRSTMESIQSGLYNGTLGASFHIITMLKKETFHKSQVKIIGTGGFSKLFSQSNLFDIEIENLVLQGLLIALRKNESEQSEPKKIKNQK